MASKTSQSLQQYGRVVSILLIALVGIVLLLNTSASSVTRNFQSERGLPVGCLSRFADETASAEAAIRFGVSAGVGCFLDPSGKSIPKTDYARPSDAVYMSTDGNDANSGTESAPVKTLNKAIGLAKTRTGRTVVVRGGEYRDGYKDSRPSTIGTINTSMTIQAYPGESPWFTGTDVVASGWAASGSTWVRDWSTPQFCLGSYYTAIGGISPVSYKQTNANDGSNKCTWADSSWDPAYPVAADPQMAFIGDTELAQKGTLAEVTPGSKSFFYDWTNRKIYVSENPAVNSIELAVRPGVMTLGGPYNFAVKGLGFKRFASAHRGNDGGSVVYAGLGGSGEASGQVQLESVVFTQNAGTTFAVSGPKNDSWVKNSVFAFNHSGGMAGNGFANSSPGSPNKFLIESSIFNSNNMGMFDTKCGQSCGVGGIKLNNMAGFTVRNSLFENTKAKAPGFWCDIDCSNGVMVNNVVRNNGGRGIFYEISSKGIIAGNLVYNNSQANISVFSATTKIYNNTVVNKIGPSVESFWIMDDKRPAPDNGATWPYTLAAMQASHSALGVGYAVRVGPNTNGLEFANNLVVAQPPDINGSLGARLMNFADYKNTGASYAKAPNTFSNEYFKVLDYNIYYHPPNKNLYMWSGTDAIKSTTQLRSVSGQSWENNTITVPDGSNPFYDRNEFDFRLKKDSKAATQKGRSIPSDVCTAIGLASTECAAPVRGVVSIPAIFY